MNNIQLLKDKIQEFNSITIFKHISPDGDAIFSSLALKSFLIDNFPNKEIKICGFDYFDLINPNEEVSDDFISNSLAISCDTSVLNRVDDNRYNNAKYKIKIDHHPVIDNYADLNIVNDSAAANCEVLFDVFSSIELRDYIISKQTAQYLLCGILTDTISFKTSNVTSHTLEVASKLTSYGLNIADLNQYLFSINLIDFKKKSFIRSKLIIEDKLGYVIFEEDDANNYQMTAKEAKDTVDEFSLIKDINVYAIFAYNKETHFYEASLRSKRKYIINQTAEKYGGGGHKNASGIKSLTLDDVHKIIKELKDIANQNNN